MKNAEKLIKSRNWRKRLIGARLASIESVLQIAKTEQYHDVCKVIVQRLEENKDLDIVKEICNELADAKSALIRKFVAENTEFEIVLQMAKYEMNYDVCEVIVRRLEENKDLDIVKEICNELADAKSSSIRKFVAENVEFEIVMQMAKIESEYYYNHDICEVIVQRLKENKDLDIVKESYNELANAKNELMRKFVAENAQIEIVLQIAKSEVDYDVCEVIVRRLEENKDLDIVKESYNKLTNVKSELILKFVISNAPTNIIEKIIKGKELYYIDIIYSIFRNPNYINATSKEKLALLKNILPKYLIDAVKYEKDEEVLLWILKKIK